MTSCKCISRKTPYKHIHVERVDGDGGVTLTVLGMSVLSALVLHAYFNGISSLICLIFFCYAAVYDFVISFPLPSRA